MGFIHRIWKPSVIVPATVAVGGFTSLVIFFRRQRKRESEIFKEPFVRRACELFLMNGPAVDLVGLPIKFKAVNMDDDFNKLREIKAQVAIPISGSHLNGTIFIWASKMNPNAATESQKVEDWELEEAVAMSPTEREKWILERFGSKSARSEREERRRWRVTRVEAKLGSWQKTFIIFDETKDPTGTMGLIPDTAMYQFEVNRDVDIR